VGDPPCWSVRRPYFASGSSAIAPTILPTKRPGHVHLGATELLQPLQ
jgi:hypothetical protein